MPKQTAIDREFPGALTSRYFMARSMTLLGPHGFEAENTIACVGLCRDELTRPFALDVFNAWGEAFNFSSLAGLLTLGKTGFGAARAHAPLDTGRERFVFISMPHIGVDDSGTFGQLRRRGHEESSTTCGALCALQDNFRDGLSTELDIEDIEQSMLRRRLFPLLAERDPNDPPDIPELTRIARAAFLADLETLIAGADMSQVDYAVFSGVQIHTPTRELIWPADSYVVIRGERIVLSMAD